jgi:hypothetical protein
MGRIAVVGAICVALGVVACDAPGPVGVENALSGSGASTQASASLHGRSVSRQLAGTITGSDEYGAVCGEGAGILITSTGTGTVSHLGLTVMVATTCVNLSDYSAIGPAPFVLRAANGDEVQGLLTNVVYTAYGFDMYTTVTGGTGRFQGATGELVFPTASNMTGVWTSGVQGWIAY